MASNVRFNDSDDEYQPSDSDDELPEREKSLLKNVRDKGQIQSDSEDEVYGVGASESDEQSDLALSDVEGQGEDDDDYGIPDAKAWGKSKRNYYATDYVDPDYGGFQGKDATMAEMEEEEARNLQTELAKTMDDDDFALDLLGKPAGVKEKTARSEEVIKTDISKLSRRQKLQLMEKESPEFFGLVEDYEKKMRIMQEHLQPCLVLWKEGKIKDCKAVEFVNTYRELIFNYCTNIYMYLLLKANKVNVHNHPIIKRLYQFRQLFTQMDSVFEEVVKAQIELIIAQNADKKIPAEINSKRKRTLKLLSNLNIHLESKANENKKNKKKKKGDESDEEGLHQKKRSKAALDEEPEDEKTETVEDLKKIVDSSDESPAEDEGEEQVEENGEVGKRAITYQIAKNKGLMPKRKKEQRNPRVKHRNKFRKAIIRRKGAVREVRTEMSRYGGEMSGIKTSVTKSIKIKT